MRTLHAKSEAAFVAASKALALLEVAL